MIGPVATQGGPTATKADCDGDGHPNATDTDDDNDGASDVTEQKWGTDPCRRDSDGDGMSDLWEQVSAEDRNARALPSPLARPYPNALDAKDASIDHDGDGLTNAEEYAAWATTSNKLREDRPGDPYWSRLTYSGGDPNSDGRGPVPATPATIDGRFYMDRDGNGFLTDFERDADGDGIPNMDEERRTATSASDVIRCDTVDPKTPPTAWTDYGIFTRAYIDCAARNTKNSACTGINQVPFYCVPIDVQKVDSLDWLSSDTDGDGVHDGQDDVDHDDVPNLDEYFADLATAPADRHYAELDACLPNYASRFCPAANADVDADGIANRDDTDDDDDKLPDATEIEYKLNPLNADTDGDGVSDGFEWYSAKDLNGANVPYPGKRPYPNPLDNSDAGLDFDGDSLTLADEFKAWKLMGRPMPLSYSDGTQYTGGKSLPTGPYAGLDSDGNGFVSDDEKDVDQDGVANWVEVNGPLSSPDWWDAWIGQRSNKCTDKYTESTYPGPRYAGLDFVDADTDGDGIKDGADDIDHDGLTNLQEVARPANWCTSYVSAGPTYASGGGTAGGHAGTDKLARVQPFNPCKPVYSDACHVHAPLGYYKEERDQNGAYTYIEDWMGATP